MHLIRSSIRGKIILSYFVLLSLFIGIASFAFIELRYVERMTTFGEIISDYLNSILEMRRFEKNFFLYSEEADYLENIGQLDRAEGIIASNAQGFNELAGISTSDKLRADLLEYRKHIASYRDKVKASGSRPAERFENEVRDVGKKITKIAEDISRTERLYLTEKLQNLKVMFLASFAILIIFVVALGWLLSRMVVRPLGELEENMKAIAEGRYSKIEINSSDREVISLTDAFNRMLRELELRQKHLVQSEKLASLGTLLSGVAHELNNPLSNISTSGQILTEEIEDPDMQYKRELLAQIEEQTERAKNIVRSLLEFSREREFKKESVPLLGLVEETIKFIKGQIPTKVEVSLSIAHDIVIHADKQRLQQALLNLMKNAIDAIGSEGQIIITARRLRGSKNTSDAELFNKYQSKCIIKEDAVEIEIRDSGCGIPLDKINHIFDPFFTTKEVGKGSGLGLSIVHEIIDEHDGCIIVDSKEGAGTAFYIYLPLPKNK